MTFRTHRQTVTVKHHQACQQTASKGKRRTIGTDSGDFVGIPGDKVFKGTVIIMGKKTHDKVGNFTRQLDGIKRTHLKFGNYKNSALKKKEVLPLVTTWVNLEHVTLSEISQAHKDKNA